MLLCWYNVFHYTDSLCEVILSDVLNVIRLDYPEMDARLFRPLIKLHLPSKKSEINVCHYWWRLRYLPCLWLLNEDVHYLILCIAHIYYYYLVMPHIYLEKCVVSTEILTDLEFSLYILFFIATHFDSYCFTILRFRLIFFRYVMF